MKMSGPRTHPIWVSAIAQSVPWEEMPPILEGLPLTPQLQVIFFCTDLWQNAHLGVWKHFVASSPVSVVESLLEAMVGRSADAKFEWISGIYTDYFKNNPPDRKPRARFHFFSAKCVFRYSETVILKSQNWPKNGVIFGRHFYKMSFSL